METIGNILKNSGTKPENLPTCKYCGKPYTWFIRDVFSGANKRTIKIPVPACKCQEIREKEEERKKYLQLRSEKLAKLFDNSMITPFFKEKTFEYLLTKENQKIYNNALDVFKCQEYAKLFTPKKSLGISMIGNVGTGKTTLLAAVCNELIFTIKPC